MSRADRWGLSEAEYQAIWAVDRGRALHRYANHRKRAALRGIEFRMTFREWWGVWQASGHYGQMGTHAGQFVMARIRDTGPYAVWNVEIQTARENVSTAMTRVYGRFGMRADRLIERVDPFDELDDYCSPNFGTLASRAAGP